MAGSNHPEDKDVKNKRLGGGEGTRDWAARRGRVADDRSSGRVGRKAPQARRVALYMPRQPAFTQAELAAIERILPQFPLRDAALLRLALHTGFRISELLALRVRDVWAGEGPRSSVTVARRHLKGGRGVRGRNIRSRTVPLNGAVAPVIRELVFSRFGSGEVAAGAPLFLSRERRPLSRAQATHRLKQILVAAGLTDRAGYGWHGARRTFAARIYKLSGHDIQLTRQVLGHSRIDTTQQYLPESDRAVAEAILALTNPAPVLDHEMDRGHVVYSVV